MDINTKLTCEGNLPCISTYPSFPFGPNGNLFVHEALDMIYVSKFVETNGIVKTKSDTYLIYNLLNEYHATGEVDRVRV